MVYQVNVGYIYKFTFNAIIENINGIYKLMNIMILDDLIEQGIDLYKDVFKNIEVTEDTFNSEILSNINDTCRIFKLQDIYNIENIYYIPEFLINQEPIHGLKKYLKLGLAVNLGVFNSIETLEWIKNEIEELLVSKTGINSNAVIFAVEEIWMTPSEYQELEDERKNNISNSESIYIKNQQLQQQISNLQNIINEYENLIINLNI